MKKGVLIALYAVGVVLSCLAGEQDKTAIEKEKQRIEQEKKALDSGQKQKECNIDPEKQKSDCAVSTSKIKQDQADDPDELQIEVVPRKQKQSTLSLFGVNIASNIALGIPVSTSVLHGNKLTVYDGLIGITIIGTPQEHFVGGWANSFLFESYRGKNIYGMFTGLNGRVHDSYGLMVSALNRAADAYGIQISAFRNVTSGRGGGLSIAFENEGAAYCGLQIGFMNSIGEAKLNRNKKAESAAVPESGSFVAQIGGTNINNRRRDFSFQVGIFNTSGGGAFQIGLLNHAENAWIPWFPIINFSGFSAEDTDSCPSSAAK